MINKQGFGIFEWPNGRIYKGSWLNGKQDGEGLFVNEEGAEFQGVWKNGKRVQWTRVNNSNKNDKKYAPS